MSAGTTYECPICTFSTWVGHPTQDGSVVGTTALGEVKHTGCGIAWPLRSSIAVLAHEPKPKRRRWWRR